MNYRGQAKLYYLYMMSDGEVSDGEKKLCLIRKTKRSEWIMKCFIIFYFIGNFSNRQK